MVFSSITFIYYFLPIVILAYFVVPSKFKNFILLLSSLAFYFYGEQKYVLILILSCVFNYIFALIIEKRKSKWFLTLFIACNLGLLGYFKYTNFFIKNINQLFGSNLALLRVIMPIGISFFTFQTLSYVVDVYRGKVKANHNFWEFATYVCLFPQLVAGPIVRYSDVQKELKERKTSFDDFGEGVKRFIIGLGKKVLIANVIGEMCSILLGLNETTVLAYILVALGYSLQIYFDFSGYSDMAIGLGRMFGFHFLENFNYPYIAQNITDFWRRWHISLSSFLKDYVYIPLGGSRVKILKHLRNLLIVWFLTGFWHGADWNFIIWGLYFGIILIIEKYFLKNFLDRHKIFSHIYTIIIVIISFIIFSVDSLSGIIIFLKNMLGFNHLPFVNAATIYYLKSYILILLIAIIGATPLLKNLAMKIHIKHPKTIDALEIIGCFVLLIVVTAFLIDASFNPFLYFRF